VAAWSFAFHNGCVFSYHDGSHHTLQHTATHWLVCVCGCVYVSLWIDTMGMLQWAHPLDVCTCVCLCLCVCVCVCVCVYVRACGCLCVWMCVCMCVFSFARESWVLICGSFSSNDTNHGQHQQIVATATHRNVLQHTATNCNTLTNEGAYTSLTLQLAATHRNTLQVTATCWQLRAPTHRRCPRRTVTLCTAL